MPKFALPAGLCALLALLVIAMLAAAASPSDGSTDPCVDVHYAHVCVALTAIGPSPSTVRMYPISDVLIFVNQDSVVHTVVFADGDCVLDVPPGEPPVNESHCVDHGHGQWPLYVGSYAYTVDGKFPGTVDVAGFPRSVSLTARTHTLRLGGQVRLRGQLTLTNPSGGPGLCAFSGRHVYSPVVRVLDRHDSNHPFQRIAMFSLRLRGQSSSQGCDYPWHLKVRPGLRTTYVADSKLSANLWKPATSKPFTVRVRH